MHRRKLESQGAQDSPIGPRCLLSPTSANGPPEKQILTRSLYLLPVVSEPTSANRRPFNVLRKDFMMTDITPGDLVLAVPIGDCTIGHNAWHQDFAHPEMDQRRYLVTWSGFSRYWRRPIIAVAGRKGLFCAGCFARQKPPERLASQRARACTLNPATSQPRLGAQAGSSFSMIFRSPPAQPC